MTNATIEGPIIIMITMLFAADYYKYIAYVTSLYKTMQQGCCVDEQEFNWPTPPVRKTFRLAMITAERLN